MSAESNVEKASQLWCLPKHQNKEMDADLCYDIIALLDAKDAEKEAEIQHCNKKGKQIIELDAEISRLKTENERLSKQTPTMIIERGEMTKETFRSYKQLESWNASLTSKLELAKKAIKALKARHDLFTDGRTTHEVVDESLCPDCIVDDLASQALLEIERSEI